MPSAVGAGVLTSRMSKSIEKVASKDAKRENHGALLLATGSQIGMRMWRDEQPGEPKPKARRDYETVGYVISGSAELQLEGSTVTLEAGDSWVVPKGAEHTYKILTVFSAVEATAPAPS